MIFSLNTPYRGLPANTIYMITPNHDSELDRFGAILKYWNPNSLTFEWVDWFHSDNWGDVGHYTEENTPEWLKEVELDPWAFASNVTFLKGTELTGVLYAAWYQVQYDSCRVMLFRLIDEEKGSLNRSFYSKALNSVGARNYSKKGLNVASILDEIFTERKDEANRIAQEKKAKNEEKREKYEASRNTIGNLFPELFK